MMIQKERFLFRLDHALGLLGSWALGLLGGPRLSVPLTELTELTEYAYDINFARSVSFINIDVNIKCLPKSQA